MKTSQIRYRVFATAVFLAFVAVSCGPTDTPRFPQLNEHRISAVGSFHGPVRWSPDGLRLAYQGGNSTEVVIQDLETGRSWNVGKHVSEPDGSIHEFAWSPLGRISYLKWRYTPGGTSLDGVEELHIADADGQNDKIIVDNLPFGTDFLWFPGGQKLVMRWAAKPTNYPIDDVYIVDSETQQHEIKASHEDLNLGIVSMALLADENSLLLNGIRELEDGRASYFVLYNLAQKKVMREIHLDPLFASGRLPDYPDLQPSIGNFSLNYVRPGKDRWIIGDFWAPAGKCYNYAIYFFNLDDVSRNFCLPSKEGPIGAISVSPIGDRIAYAPTNGPGNVWIMVAELTPEIRHQLER